MHKLLVAGLYLPGSGLTNVLTALVSELRQMFDIRCLGFAPLTRSGEEDLLILGREARIRRGPARAFAAEPCWLQREFTEHRPETVLVIGPAFLVAPFLRQLQPWRAATRIVLYLPIEGSLANDEFAPILELVDTCVTYTESALSDVAALCAAASTSRADYRAPQLEVIGHGVDTATFFPIPAPDERARRRLARRALYTEDLDDAFIALNSNRPYFRKRLDLTIAAFGLFARDKPDAHLHLHTGRRSAHEEEALVSAIATTGLERRIHMTPQSRGGAIQHPEWLNALYNACDVGLSTAMGEGWGLGLFEHAATRAALVAPAHTGFTENWRDAAILVPAPAREFIFYEAADMAVVAPADVAAALENLYRDRALLDDLASSAFARTNEERYKWKAVAARFAAVLREGIDHVEIRTAPQRSPERDRERCAIANARH